MKQIQLLQYDYKSHFSVFSIDNLLPEDYLQKITDKTIELTTNDTMDRSTNVKANMTSYIEILKHSEYQQMFDSIMEYLNIFIKLRTPHWNRDIDYYIKEAWGMQHTKGDYTQNHVHPNTNWSIAFYLRVPTNDTYMYFDDFNDTLPLATNRLFIFPGLAKHRVTAHTSDITRISIAANINAHQN